jgi:gamma-glutamylaminecyclotransferase
VARVLLFVYGSLKREGRHHGELCGARFVAEARTARGFGLVPLGPYVALVDAPGRTTDVTGELFEVDEALLVALDAFEGDDYERREVTVAYEGMPNGVTAVAYFESARAKINDP